MKTSLLIRITAKTTKESRGATIADLEKDIRAFVKIKNLGVRINASELSFAIVRENKSAK